MKKNKIKFIFLILAMFLMSQSVKAQWTLQHNFNPNSNDGLFNIYFLNENTGYVFGGSNYPTLQGYIYKTIDGGNTWTNLNIGVTPVIMSGFFTDSLIGYAVGGNGLILKTIDGGVNWTAQQSGTSQRLYTTYFVSSSIGFAGGDSIFLKTIDGGNTWTSSIVTGLLTDIVFFNSDTGFVVGTNPNIGAPPNGSFIWKTTDGGNNWNVKYWAGWSLDIRSIQFVNSSTGYAVGYNQQLKTIDGGDNWTLLNLPPDAGTYDLFFTGIDTGYVSGIDYTGSTQNPLIAKTTDGGITWTFQSISTNTWLYCLHFINSNLGYAAGFRGGVGPEIHKTMNGGIFSGLESFNDKSKEVKLYPIPTHEKLTFKFNSYIEKLQIINSTGSIIFELHKIDMEKEIVINHLNSGIYFYNAIQKNKSLHGKFIIE